MVAGVERSHRKEMSGQREAEVDPVHDLLPILSHLCGHEEMIKRIITWMLAAMWKENVSFSQIKCIQSSLIVVCRFFSCALSWKQTNYQSQHRNTMSGKTKRVYHIKKNGSLEGSHLICLTDC